MNGLLSDKAKRDGVMITRLATAVTSLAIIGLVVLAGTAVTVSFNGAKLETLRELQLDAKAERKMLSDKVDSVGGDVKQLLNRKLPESRP